MLRIGDFARLGRVTIKALRHYEKAGLLKPREVDGQTGYRHYAPEQLAELSRILLLKDFGFRLDEIRRLLGDEGRLEAALEARRHSLRAAVEADRRRLQRLDAFQSLVRGEFAPPPVRLRALEPVLALTCRNAKGAGGGEVQEMFEAAERTVARAGVRADASPFLLFHELTDRAEELDVEVCIPVAEDGEGLQGVRLVPGCVAAGVVVYQGPYDQTPGLFAALAQWLRDSGHRIEGPLREVYHRFGADQRGYRLPSRVLADGPAQYVTELQAPVVLETGGSQ